MKFLFLLLASTSLYAKSPFTQSIAKQEIIAHGKTAYERRCASCHGIKGDGNGPGAIFLDPKPRAFNQGIYKFSSAGAGTLPSDADLMHTLSLGILGSSMPNFAFVPEQERFAIIQYLKTFSEVWNDPENYGVPLQGSPFPKDDFIDYQAFIARAEKGRGIYIEACATCHGLKGYGDGDSSEDLEDEWGNKIMPANLAKPYIKSGKDVRAIYKRLITGVGGTPMVSFKDSYTDDQLWDVTAFVLYLRGVEAGLYGDDLPIKHIQLSEYE